MLDENDHLIKQGPFTFITGGITEKEGEHIDIAICSIRVWTTDPVHEPQHDVAFMRLRRRLDSKKYPPIAIEGINQIKPDTPLFLTGYYHRESSTNDNHPMTEKCGIVLNIPNLSMFLHRCSSTHRMSGSPLYAVEASNPVLIGMLLGVDESESFDDEEDAEYNLRHANQAVDGKGIHDAFVRYGGSGLIAPFRSSSGCN